MPFTSSIHNNGMKNKIKERREKNAMKWFDCFIRVPPHECCRSSAGRLHRDGVNERESESWRAKEPPKETRSIHKMFMEMVLSCSLANATLNNFWSGFLVSNSNTANRQRVDWLEREIFFFSFICDFQCVYCNQWALIRLSLCVYIPFWYGIHSPSQWIDMELRERNESVNEASVCHLNCHTNFSTFTQTIQEKIWPGRGSGRGKVLPATMRLLDIKCDTMAKIYPQHNQTGI